MQERISRIPQAEGQKQSSWTALTLDTILAIGGSLLITLLIYVQHWYPTIPNISIVYLLIILPLATWRGRYPALLAALVAFASFDFFLVPPFYTLTIARSEEWVALITFLSVALVTSQLAATTRQRAEQAWQREREARILYETIRTARSADTQEERAELFTLALVRVFAAWGVRECGLLLPDGRGQWKVCAEAPIQIASFQLSEVEETLVTEVAHTRQGRQAIHGASLLRVIPLKESKHIIGIVCLRIEHALPWFLQDAFVDDEMRTANPRATFFWTFLDQFSTKLEHGQLSTR